MSSPGATKTEVLARIAAGESQTTEFKESTGQLRRAVETLAAFGSQPDGGIVIIGVNDAGQPRSGFQIGATTEEKVANEIRLNTLSMTTGHPLAPRIYRFEDPLLLVIVVDPSSDGPYLAYGKRFARSGKSTGAVDVDYRQLARAYQQHLYDDDGDYPGFRFCARCGSQRLRRVQYPDYANDRLYFVVECEECRWGEWTE